MNEDRFGTALDLTGLRELAIQIDAIEQRLFELDDAAAEHKCKVLAELRLLPEQKQTLTERRIKRLKRLGLFFE